MTFVFDPQPPVTLPVVGTNARFPIRRVFCVGRNYQDHVIEMGGIPDRDPPFFFAKPADAVHQNDTVPYPSHCEDFHHEMEFVIAIGTAGTDITLEAANDHVFGYAAGVDLTRRDYQAWAKKNGRPWTMAKGFDHSAPMSAINPASLIGHPEGGAMRLSVNGSLKQDGDLGMQIWKAPEIVSRLSEWVELKPGDLIMTGTPAGVGPLQRGDRVEGEIEGIGALGFTVT